MSLNQRILELCARKERLERLTKRPDPFVNHFPLGVGQMSAGQARRLGASTDRIVRLAGELVGVRRELAYYEAIAKRVAAGECHENGQPRADSPSRVRAANAVASYAEFLHATLKPGDNVELVCNGEILPIGRANRKSVTLASGSRWEPFDIKPLNADGSKMSDDELKTALRTWQASRTSKGA